MNGDKKEKKKIVWWILFLCYLAGISYFLFFSEHYGRTNSTTEYRYNLVLFQEIKRFLLHSKTIGLEGAIVNLLGNIIAFMPFGFCLPIVSKKDRKLWKVLLWGFLFSFTVETIQLVYRVGIFDVDDLLLNTVGAVWGYWCYCLLNVCKRHGGKKRVSKKGYR